MLVDCQLSHESAGLFSLVEKLGAKERIACADEDVNIMVIIITGSPIAAPPGFPKFIAVSKFAESGFENLR